MRFLTSKWALVAIGLFVVIVGIVVFRVVVKEEVAQPVTEEPTATESRTTTYRVIGRSVEGRKIEAYTYPSLSSGSEEAHLLFVGGVHGGYEWNSVLLAYELIDYLTLNPGEIPEGLTVTVIPSANPDGVSKVIGVDGRFTRADVPEGISLAPGRFNARGVDLNRNFDCKWKPESMWRGDVVSAGSAPFSEPESAAIREFVLEHDPDAVVFWHSQSDAVYASECEAGILPGTLDLMNIYSQASGYPAVSSFDFYEITGDAEGWLASIGIPAITVELSTHESIEWEENLAGATALFLEYEK